MTTTRYTRYVDRQKDLQRKWANEDPPSGLFAAKSVLYAPVNPRYYLSVFGVVFRPMIAFYWALRVAWTKNGKTAFQNRINFIVEKEEESLRNYVDGLKQYQESLQEGSPTVRNPKLGFWGVFSCWLQIFSSMITKIKKGLGMDLAIKYDVFIAKLKLLNDYLWLGEYEEALTVLESFEKDGMPTPMNLLKIIEDNINRFSEVNNANDRIQRIRASNTAIINKYHQKKSKKSPRNRGILILTALFLTDILSTLLTSIINVISIRIIGGAFSALWVLLSLLDPTQNHLKKEVAPKFRRPHHTFMALTGILSSSSMVFFVVSYWMLHSPWMFSLLLISHALYMFANLSTAFMQWIEYMNIKEEINDNSSLTFWGKAQKDILRLMSTSAFMAIGSMASIILLVYTGEMLPFTDLWMYTLCAYLLVYIAMDVYGRLRSPTPIEQIISNQNEPIRLQLLPNESNEIKRSLKNYRENKPQKESPQSFMEIQNIPGDGIVEELVI